MNAQQQSGFPWYVRTLMVLAVLAIPAIAYKVLGEQQRWEEFKTAHHCEIDKTRQDTGRFDAWMCDDGDTYYIAR